MTRRSLFAATALGALATAFSLLGSSSASFTATSDNPHEFRAIADWVAPASARTVAVKQAGGTPGFVRPGGAYYVAASVSDGGNPSSGIASVTANVSSLTAGRTAEPLTAGSFSYAGQSYTHRSALLTAGSLGAGSYGFSLALADGAGNGGSHTGLTAVVDGTAPAASSVATANGSGGTAGRPQAGDRVTYTHSEQLDPYSLIAGWGGASTAVTATITNNASADTLTVTASGTSVPLGSLNLRGDYVTATATWNATLAQSSGQLTLTLGSLVSGTVRTDSVARSPQWTTSTAATDRAGNAVTAATITAPSAVQF